MNNQILLATIQTQVYLFDIVMHCSDWTTSQQCEHTAEHQSTASVGEHDWQTQHQDAPDVV
jgi:hypothetical protein